MDGFLRITDGSLKIHETCKISEEENKFLVVVPKFVSSDRSSYSDDVLVYIQLPLFEIWSIQAFLHSVFFSMPL